MLYLKVPRSEAESVRRKLMSEGILSPGYEIIKEGAFVCFPVSKKYGDYETLEIEGQERISPPARLKDALAGLLTGPELESFIGSFDILGDIAVVEIPEGLEPKEKEIGAALLQVHKNLRTVLKKLGGMEGEFRVRRFACIAGENRTETVYRESGLKMRLDLAKVYFSPRLATERSRIAELTKNGERVLVLFAGVGPFALAIAKQKPETKITAVELNPEAVRYMKENIALNKAGNVEAIEADARTLAFRDEFDRVIMPLPKSAHEFLGVAFAAAKDGATVHFYTIADSKDAFNEAAVKAKEAAEKSKTGIKIMSQRIVRPYSPSRVQVVLDIEIKK
ncbi:MAG TPA: class I SAM-dependent methyltransferase family protein [Candidatus Bilamarchaeum sp.]|nr:class I SAM-dependent methyltransferase family protein [Candidatus Bilamarchaeum sp.]